MDRIDAMKVFVSAVDEGSLAGAGRRLRRSPAAVSRAIAFLEAHVGAELLHRTTRSRSSSAKPASAMSRLAAAFWSTLRRPTSSPAANARRRGTLDADCARHHRRRYFEVDPSTLS
jgi:DNA-binding transcriptional LysR family regulator